MDYPAKGGIALVVLPRCLSVLQVFLGVLRKVFPVIVSGIVVVTIGFSLGRTAVGWMIGDGSIENIILGVSVILLIFILQFTTKNIAGVHNFQRIYIFLHLDYWFRNGWGYGYGKLAINS